jgi:hypothetical protein
MAETKQAFSPITGGKAINPFVKSGVTYYFCEDTGTIFCNKLNQAGMVGGGHEQGRNNKEDNLTRISRIKSITTNEAPKVLDFGCGHGLLVNDMNANGCKAKGYDPFVPEFNQITKGYECITLIEVIEHITYPFDELNLIYNSLNEGGYVYVETSFSDWIKPDSFYVSPDVGHCTIWSHKGLDYIFQKFGFKVDKHINQNVRIYTK